MSTPTGAWSRCSASPGISASARHSEAELLRLAVTDALTAVWNRRHGEQLFQAELTDARETGRPLTLLMLDIDHFKSINDRYGHQAGDRALIEVRRRLQQGSAQHRRGGARWGGEEFVILLRDADIDDAVVTAEKLRVGSPTTPFRRRRMRPPVSALRN